MSKLVSDYFDLGKRHVDYWSPEWDYAHDMLMAYAPLSKEDLQSLSKGHPKRFTLPMTATQLTTMATFISQVLFGDDRPHKVRGRGPEDEVPAEHINTLLKWNSEQQPTYLLGYLWVLDALSYNRGVFYNSWAHIMRPKREQVAMTIPGEVEEDGTPRIFQQWQTRMEPVAAYCKAELVSPYDWVCDPGFPLHRFQEGRFAGHRFQTTLVDLEHRSKLPIEDPRYVLPSAVAEIREKTRKAANSTNLGVGGPPGTTSASEMSRTAYERQQPGVGLASGFQTTADKHDRGVLDCVEIWVKIRPSDYQLYDGQHSVVFQIQVAEENIILSVNESTYDHGQFPYSVAEARPSGHYQFSPSWAFMLKGLQDHVDYLKNRHQEALQRTVGNVFIVDPEAVDIDDFLDPKREGQIIALKKPGPIKEAIQQIPIKDLTERFDQEAQMFINLAENVTGANNYMQGAPGDAGSATEFAGTQQMAAGRMSSVARLLSVQGVVPQTKQFVSMFQQFLEESQRVRYDYNPMQSPEALAGARVLEIGSDTIQGEFDFVASDGTLPTGDAKKVAAITALLQSSAAFPQVFTPAPGNLDPKALILAGAMAAGLTDIERFKYTQDSFTSSVQGQVMSQEGIMPEVPPGQFGGGGGIPFNTPGPDPAVPGIGGIEAPSIAPVGPPQVRPANF